MSGWDGNWAAESNWNKCSAFKHVQSRCGEHSHTRGSKGFLYENKLKIICDLLTCTLQRGRSGLRWVDLQPERARSLLHTPHPLQQWTGREKKKHLRKTLHVFSIAEGFNGLIILLLQQPQFQFIKHQSPLKRDQTTRVRKPGLAAGDRFRNIKCLDAWKHASTHVFQLKLSCSLRYSHLPSVKLVVC